MHIHSDVFIAEMKTKLEAEKAHLAQQLQLEGGFPDYGRNDEDNATEIGDYTATASTTTALEERLSDVTAALDRIATGTYGQTAEGDLIPEDRLRANPAATTLVK